MNRNPVSSSTLASVGYDPQKKILEIEFVHHTIYEYLDVPEEVYTELINASSLGKYFNEVIRDTYQVRQVA